MPTLAKHPTAVLDFTVDWSAWLNGDRIESTVWTVPGGVTKLAASGDGDHATVWLSGGTLGQSYTIRCQVHTEAGRDDYCEFSVGVSASNSRPGYVRVEKSGQVRTRETRRTPDIALGFSSVPSATWGKAFGGVQATGYGGAGDYTFSLTGAPDGLEIDASTGAISGYPEDVGTFDLTITATDSAGAAVSSEITVTVALPRILTGLNGNGSTPDDVAINAALDSDDPVFVLPANKTYLINDPLVMPTGAKILGHPDGGVLIQAKDDWGARYCITHPEWNPASLGARDSDIWIAGLTIDGAVAENTAITEHAHGIGLRAAAGVKVLDVAVRNCKGDGLYAGSANGNYEVGCGDLKARITATDNDRQGVALVSCDGFTLEATTSGNRYFGVDLEPNRDVEAVKNGTLELISNADGLGTFASGGLGMSNNGAGATIEDVDITVSIINSGGQGIVARNCIGVTIRGLVQNVTLAGFDAIGSGDFGSTIDFDGLVIEDAGEYGFRYREIEPGEMTGTVSVKDATLVSMHLTGCAGELNIHLEDGAQQGLTLSNCQRMNFPNAVITGHGSHGVRLTNLSSRNTFPTLTSTGNAGYGIMEEAGQSCDYNVSTGSTLTNNTSGASSKQGANSSFT